MDKRTRDALLDIYERLEVADEALQEYWPRLEAVVHDDVMERLRDTRQALESMDRIVMATFGGMNELIRARNERVAEERAAGDWIAQDRGCQTQLVFDNGQRQPG